MTVLTTSIPSVIDAVCALIRGLNLTVDNDPVEVFDGLAGPNIPDVYVQVGGIEQTAVTGAQAWHSLGAANGVAPAREERYEINCGVFAYVGGTDASNAGASDAQKTARDLAFTIVDAIESALRTNPKLATVTAGDGLLPGNGLGTGWVEFGGRIDLEETTAADPKADMGRRANVVFNIGIYKVLFSN